MTAVTSTLLHFVSIITIITYRGFRSATDNNQQQYLCIQQKFPKINKTVVSHKSAVKAHTNSDEYLHYISNITGKEFLLSAATAAEHNLPAPLLHLVYPLRHFANIAYHNQFLLAYIGAHTGDVATLAGIL